MCIRGCSWWCRHWISLLFLIHRIIFFFYQRIQFPKYNFLIQDRGWKIFGEGGRRLIFLFLSIIQIGIICWMLYSDCRTTCRFHWSWAKEIWEPQKHLWQFFFFPSSNDSESTSRRCISERPGLTRDVWAPGGLWSCPQLSSAPLTSSCLPAPAARSTGLCSSWAFSPSHTAHGAGHVDRMRRWGYPTPLSKCLQADKQ